MYNTGNGEPKLVTEVMARGKVQNGPTIPIYSMLMV